MIYRTSVAVANVITRYSRDCPQFSGKCILYWSFRRSLLRRPHSFYQEYGITSQPSIPVHCEWISDPLYSPVSRFSSHFKGTPGIKGSRQLYLMGRRNECSAQGGRPWPLSKLEGRGGQEGRCATSFIWPANGAGTWRKTAIAVRDPLRSCLLASVVSELLLLDPSLN